MNTMERKENTTGRNIKRLREEAGFSQKNIAEYLNIDQSLISLIEKGERKASLSMIESLSALFCCEVKQILKGDENGNKYRIAFRAKNMESEDMQALAAINRIALNQMRMEQISKEEC